MPPIDHRISGDAMGVRPATHPLPVHPLSTPYVSTYLPPYLSGDAMGRGVWPGGDVGPIRGTFLAPSWTTPLTSTLTKTHTHPYSLTHLLFN